MASSAQGCCVIASKLDWFTRLEREYPSSLCASIDMAMLRVSEGDILAIPAKQDGRWGFVLGQIFHFQHSQCYAEVFSDFQINFEISESEVLKTDLSIANRLFNLVSLSLDFNKYFGNIKWQILANNKNFDANGNKYSNVEFASSEYQRFGIYYNGGKEFFEGGGLSTKVGA